MKNFFLSALFLLILTACSTDDTATSWENNGIVNNEVNLKNASNSLPECFIGMSPTLSVDLTNGINNPQFDFGVTIKDNLLDPRTTKYLLSTEMQALADCEDLTIPQGGITKITNPTYFGSVNKGAKPVIRLQKSQMMTGCYRWRVVIDGYAVSNNAHLCTTATDWQDSPVY